MTKIRFFSVCLFLSFSVNSFADKFDVGADIKVRISRAEASEAQPGEGIEKSFDGSLATIYHSNWSGTEFPVTLTYYFEDVERIDYLVYNPRYNGSNGRFMEFELWILEQQEYVKYGDYDFAGLWSPSKITFTEGIISPKAIRFVVKSGVGDLVSCAEMGFYQKNTQTIIPPVFTDETCSELLPGVDRRTVRAIENGFYKQLALNLLSDSDYKKKRVFEIESRPAGGFTFNSKIEVKKGDEIITFMEKTNDGSVFLSVANNNTGSIYLLNEGPNRIISDRHGWIMLLNRNAEPVKIHIATGKINKGWVRRDHRKKLRDEENKANEEGFVEVAWSNILTPKQMKEDIDFFLKFLKRTHPNMYAFVSKDSVKIRKKKLYEICSEPMTVKEFHLQITQLNSMFDVHTQIIFDFSQYVSAKFVFPRDIKIIENQLFFEDKKVLSINDLCVDELFATINSIFHHQDISMQVLDLNLTFYFPALLYHISDARSPFTIRVENAEGEEIEYVVEGTPGEDIDAMQTLFAEELRDFRIYPDESVAIIEYSACKDEDNFSDWVDEKFNIISDEGIQHLFIDISRNGGGSTIPNQLIYKQIEHNGFNHIMNAKVIISREWIQKSVNSGLPPLVERSLVRLKYGKRYKTTERKFYPPTTGYKGNIYLIQGRRTGSAALDMSSWFKSSGIGTVIGEETGGRSALFASILRRRLPNSKFSFWASTTYTEYPGGNIERGILPDIPVELDYSKKYYELEDLKRFLEIIGAEKK